MKRPNIIALSASFAMAVAVLGLFSSTTTHAPQLTEINGTRVTNLAPIVVHPDTNDAVASL